MIDIGWAPANGRGDGISRRNFLRVGALGPLGLSLPALWAAERAAGAAPAPGRPARARSVLLVFLGG
ncbi:MAG: DUF1501 domain-containing protein, partial [Verrucomicrobiota bacterium]